MLQIIIGGGGGGTSSIYPLDGLTAAAITNMRGAWAVQVLFTTAAAFPVIQLQNSAGTLSQDFFGNNTGAFLSTAANGSGSTVAAWMSTNSIATAFVSRWYDQSYYARGSTGTKYDATTSTTGQRPTLNLTTYPYSVDGTGNANAFFNLPSGTVVGNSTYTFSAKFDYGVATRGGFIGGGVNGNNQTNNLRWDTNPNFQNYWFFNDYNFGNSSVLSTTTVVTLINYNNGNAPTTSAGTTFTGGTTGTVYTSTTFINGVASTTNPTLTTRSGWNFQSGSDVLMKTTSDESLQSRMYWCINSSQAICQNDRVIIEAQNNGTSTDPNFANVILLMHFDGANNSAVFIDSSLYNATMSVPAAYTTGTAPVIRTVVSRFGTASLRCTAGSNRVVNPLTASTLYSFGAGTNFTIEFWVYFNALPTGLARFIGTMNRGLTNTWQIYYNNSSNRLVFWTNQNPFEIITSNANPFVINTWYHIALTRVGNTYYMFIGGNLQSTVTSALTIDLSTDTNQISIGGSGFTGDTSAFDGYIDEVRITARVARYTASFTAPTAAFPEGAYALDGLTAAAISNMRGAWAIRVLFSAAASYPVIRLQNSAGTLSQDFFGDSTGIFLSTGASRQGATVSAWMTANSIPTAFVSTWYDQSVYARSGIQYNATTASTGQRPTLNLTTTPYSVNSTGNANAFFNLPSGTVVGNSSYTFSAKVVFAKSSGGIIGAGASLTTNRTNNFRFASSSQFNNYWFNNNYTFNNATAIPNPITVTVINYLRTDPPTLSAGSTFSGGTTTTLYTSAAFINTVPPSTNPTLARTTGWNFLSGNDSLMRTSTTTETLESMMYWCINSAQAICQNDRDIIEAQDNIVDSMGLYTISYPFVFTNCSATGTNGPTLAQMQTAYSSKSWTADTAYLNNTSGVQLWTVPRTGQYTIIAAGARGGAGNSPAGNGVVVSTTVSLTANEVIKIVVGQLGSILAAGGTTKWGGGGGGTFVTRSTNSAILVAGGGGGGGNQTTTGPGLAATVQQNGTNGGGGSSCPGGTSGNGAPTTNGGGAGGGGLLSDAGGSGGKGFNNGSAGLANNAWFFNGAGGFGGGGVGGGGYSGGGGVQSGGQLGGGGGGSYDENTPTVAATLYTGPTPPGITTVSNGFNTGHGFVSVTRV